MNLQSATTAVSVRRIMSVVQGNNAQLIAHHVRPLWIGTDDAVCDLTWGKGGWWKIWIPQNFVGHDLHTLDGVDFRALPEADSVYDVVAFDPPYVSIGGRETTGIPEMHEKYGMHTTPRTPAETMTMIEDGIREGARVLVSGGRLLVKCSDYISSGQFQMGHHAVIEAALRTGLTQVDEFIHFTGTGPQPTENLDGSKRQQVHSHRAHSFLCVFEV